MASLGGHVRIDRFSWVPSSFSVPLFLQSSRKASFISLSLISFVLFPTSHRRWFALFALFLGQIALSRKETSHTAVLLEPDRVSCLTFLLF